MNKFYFCQPASTPNSNLKIIVSAIALSIALLLTVSGCAHDHPRKSGAARRVQTTTVTPTNSVTTLSSEISQAEDPAQPSSQFSEKKSRQTLPLPAASKLIERSFTPDEAGKTISTEKTIVLAAPTVQTVETEESYGATLGAAQKDDSHALAARFQNLRPVQFAGLVMIAGAGALGYFTGRWKAPAIIAGAGLALILIAHAIVGHELLVLLIALGAALMAGLYEARIHGFFANSTPLPSSTVAPATPPVHPESSAK